MQHSQQDDHNYCISIRYVKFNYYCVCHLQQCAAAGASTLITHKHSPKKENQHDSDLNDRTGVECIWRILLRYLFFKLYGVDERWNTSNRAVFFSFHLLYVDRSEQTDPWLIRFFTISIMFTGWSLLGSICLTQLLRTRLSGGVLQKISRRQV